MNPKLQPWLCALIFLILAGTTRFARLGDWSFANDEGYTKIEVATMTTPSFSDPMMNVVPKVIPLSFALHDIGCRVFGSSEFGSRVMSAFAGTLSIPCIVLLMWLSLGARTSLIVGFLLLLWPEHLFQSQQFRFYSFAFLFTSLALGIGLLSHNFNSLSLLVASCGLGVLALLSHTICAPLFGVLFLAEVAHAWSRKRIDRVRLLVVVLTNLAVFGDYLVRVQPLAGDMTKMESWCPSTISALQSAVQLIGWPTFLFAALGGMRMLVRRSVSDFFWLGGMFLWVAQSVILPLAMPFHADYLFPLGLVMIVSAGVAIEFVAGLIARTSKVYSVAFIVVACLMPLPSVASYYSDGSRYDFRRAGAYATEQSTATDRYAGYNCTVLNQYLPQNAVYINCPDAVDKLIAMRKQPGRIWIIVTRGRNPLDEELADWLREHATLKKQFRKQRFDYYEYCVDVYLDSGR